MMDVMRPLLIFGAHPDDIEFGCGGIIACETSAGRDAHFVVCSQGEAAKNVMPEERATESNAAAEFLVDSILFIYFDV
jgi:LmbE family N-acetylglucosaminyl deacetylase